MALGATGQAVTDGTDTTIHDSPTSLGPLWPTTMKVVNRSDSASPILVSITDDVQGRPRSPSGGVRIPVGGSELFRIEDAGFVPGVKIAAQGDGGGATVDCYPVAWTE